MEHEPVITTAAIVAAIGALITLLVSFGVDITETQTKAIAGFALVVVPFILAFIARTKTAAWADVAAKREGSVLVAGPAAIQPDGTHVVVTTHGAA